MIGLAEKLTALGFVPGLDFTARDDGAGPYIEHWLSSAPQPSAEAIAAAGPVVPDRVSARQFRMQLRVAGLHDQVTAWVATQSPLVQDAFEYSSAFVRAEPMMAAGFAALGYSPAAIAAFYIAAAAL